MKEIWKDIDGFEKSHQVSNMGQVRTKSRTYTRKDGAKIHYEGRILKLNTFCRYPTVGLNYLKKKKREYVHRIVAKAFIPNPNNLPQINHKDENTSNNSVNNLEWCTQSYNNLYGTKNERMSESKRRIILQLSKEGDILNIFLGKKAIENELGIKGGDVFNCCTGKSKLSHGYQWKYIEDVMKK